MSLFGSTKVKESLIGSIHLLKKVNGYSAYELAVKNGFKGTEKEWLESLKGKNGAKGDKGDAGTLESHTEVDAQGHRVINVAEPVEDTDAATYKQVKVEDISDDFIGFESERYSSPSAYVWKQGKVISGSVVLIHPEGREPYDEDETLDEDEKLEAKKTLFKIKDAYLPAGDVIPCLAIKQVVDTTNETVTNEVVAAVLYDNGILYTNDVISGRFTLAVSFTYICK